MSRSYDVVWAAIAEQDLTAIIKYIHADNPQAAIDCLQRIKTNVSTLDALPLRGRIVPELLQQGVLQYRELIISRWRIIYRVSGSSVYVLAVIDSRKNIEDVLLYRLI
jgi:toxin ParE1/3/4